MAAADIAQVHGWHAHVYFDALSVGAARALYEEIAGRFPVEMGRFHERLVGPHPRWSYQIAFRPDLFGAVVPWLTLNRGDLTVFVHPETGDDLVDHRDRAVWLGEKLALDLSVLT